MKRLILILALAFPLTGESETPLGTSTNPPVVKSGVALQVRSGGGLDVNAGATADFTGATVTGLDVGGITGGTSGHVITASGATTLQDSGTALSSLALDSAVVHKAGNETVGGVKTLTSSPILNTGGVSEIIGGVAINSYLPAVLTFDPPEDGVQGGIVSINSGDGPTSYGSYVQVFGGQGGGIGIQIEAGDGKPGSNANGSDVLIYAGNRDGVGTSGSIKLFAGDPTGYEVNLTPTGWKFVGVAGFAPTASGYFGYDSTSNTFKAGANGTGKTMAFTSDVSAVISDTAYDATTWNGVTTIAPSKNAVRDKIETLAPIASPTFTGLSTFDEATVTGDFTIGLNGDGGTINLAGQAVSAVTAIATSATVSRSVSFPDASGTVALTNANTTSWAAIPRASGFDTFTATPTSANLKALLTDEVGSATGKVQFVDGTLVIASGKTATFDHTSTFTTTDSQTYTFPTTSATIARTDAANTFTGDQTISGDLTISGGDLTLTGASTITGGAGNMTITSGTGASRTLILRTTTSGGTATTALTLDASQNATFANGVTVTGNLSADLISASNTSGFRWSGSGTRMLEDGDGQLRVRNNGANSAGYMVQTRKVTAKTADYTVLATTDPSTFFTNAGASGTVIFTLPTAAAGLTYTFYVAAAQTLEVLAGASTTITIAGSTSASAGNITNATVGGCITIVAVSATSWVTQAHEGTWTVN